jgi:hypothetical protein
MAAGWDSTYQQRVREACDDALQDRTEVGRTIEPLAGMFWPRVRADMNAEYERRGIQFRV